MSATAVGAGAPATIGPQHAASSAPDPHGQAMSLYTRRSRTTLGVLARADDLAALTVLDEQGGAIVLGTLWAERPAVIVFIRHFG
jgi:hypothetical protein